MTGHWKEGGFDRSRYFVRKAYPDVARALAILGEAVELNGGGKWSNLLAHTDELQLLFEWLKGKERDYDKRYFVLRYDCEDGVPADPHARLALKQYAGSVLEVNQEFATDLYQELTATQARAGIAEEPPVPHPPRHQMCLECFAQVELPDDDTPVDECPNCNAPMAVKSPSPPPIDFSKKRPHAPVFCTHCGKIVPLEGATAGNAFAFGNGLDECPHCKTPDPQVVQPGDEHYMKFLTASSQAKVDEQVEAIEPVYVVDGLDDGGAAQAALEERYPAKVTDADSEHADITRVERADAEYMPPAPIDPESIPDTALCVDHDKDYVCEKCAHLAGYMDIVFTRQERGPAAPPEQVFVEVEHARTGRSMGVGRWIKRGDYDVLRVHDAGFLGAQINALGDVLMRNSLFYKQGGACEIAAVTLSAAAGGGCLHAGTGRGDCEHYVGLPGLEQDVPHDGPRTQDIYGKPNGWCWPCWRGRQAGELEAEVEKAMFTVRQLCGAHIGTVQATCPVCEKGKLHELCQSIRNAIGTVQERDKTDLCKKLEARGFYPTKT